MTATNLEKSCEYLITKAHPSYNKDTCGHCAAAVRSAVDFGFSTHVQKTESAKNYGPSYEKIGFKNILTYPCFDKATYKPLLGDICIIQYEPYGHICMFTSKGWISDFIQSDMYGGPIRKKDPKFDIYRYG